MKPRAGGEYGMDMDGLGRIDSAHCSGVAVEGVDAALERGEAALDAEVDGVGVAEAVADDEAGDERRVDHVLDGEVHEPGDPAHLARDELRLARVQRHGGRHHHPQRVHRRRRRRRSGPTPAPAGRRRRSPWPRPGGWVGSRCSLAARRLGVDREGTGETNKNSGFEVSGDARELLEQGDTDS